MAKGNKLTDFELVRMIHLDQKEALLYLYDAGFPFAERLISSKGGTADEVIDTLNSALVQLWREINQHHFNQEKTLQDYLRALIKTTWHDKKLKATTTVPRGGTASPSDKKVVVTHFDPVIASRCVEILDPEHRTTLCYYFFENHDFIRIAKLLNMQSPERAKEIFHTAYNELLKILRTRHHLLCTISDAEVMDLSDLAMNRASGGKKEVLEIKVKQDPTYEVEFALAQVIKEGVQLSRIQELTEVIVHLRKQKVERKSRVPAWAVVTPTLLLIAFGVWWALDGFTFTKNEHPFMSFLHKKDSNELKKPDEKGGKAQSLIKPDKTGNKRDSIVYSQMTQDTSSRKNPDSMYAIPPGQIKQININGDVIVRAHRDTTAESIVVKKDELFFTIYSKVIDKDEIDSLANAKKDTTQKSTAQQTANALNPEAKLPEENLKQPKVCQVELWKSPVNYKGYKMAKNKVVLYGLDNPELVRIYNLNNSVYLGYENDFYKLESTFDFLSYSKVRDKTVLNKLKEQ